MTDRHTLTDRDGDTLGLYDHDGGLYVTACVHADGPAVVGPFTRAQLEEALDTVAPPHDDPVVAERLRACTKAGLLDEFRKSQDALIAALEQRDRARERAEIAEEQRDEWQGASRESDRIAEEARAERNEARSERDLIDHVARDHAATVARLRHALDLPEDADADAMMERAAEPRPLTPDAITTEDLRGVVRVVVIGPNGRDYDRGDLYSHGARAVIQDYGHTLKVFAAPPPPPEWADLADKIDDAMTGPGGIDGDTLAERLHAEGVRVVTEEGS